MKIFVNTVVNNHYLKVAEGFNLELFKALKPSFVDLEVKRFDGCKKSDRFHLVIGLFKLFRQDWIGVITEDGQNEEEAYFIDEGVKLPKPLIKWKHKHRIIKQSEFNSLIRDEIEYFTNNSLLDWLIWPVMKIQFSLRSPIYKKIFNAKGEK